MTENRVKKLWTAIVTAFLALCTALGFITSTATTATAQTGPTHTGGGNTGGSENKTGESRGGESTAAESRAGETGARETRIAEADARPTSGVGERTARHVGDAGHAGSGSDVGAPRARGEATAGSAPTGSASATNWPATSSWDWFSTRSLPPTMKQRILAEAHGKSPSCRHRPLSDADAAEDTTACDTAEPDEPSIPLQR
ncbi:DUF6344 domain-containing protein [Streptomyces sp. NPDC001388]|uniref:DUF6344 domain-containing protein n=1 Tax=Streptomyces sp. NPDC001388 TaxID=3364568 RepID=UPI003690D231